MKYGRGTAVLTLPTFYLAVDLVQLRRVNVVQRASYFAFSFETIFILFSILHDEMWSGSSIVRPSNITVILRMAITSLHGAANTTFQYPVSHYSDISTM